MSLNIYPSNIGKTMRLKVSYEDDKGEIIEAFTNLEVNAPNLRTTEESGERLFLITFNNLLLCSADRGDFV